MTAHDWSSADLLLPERARLLHIGPHKTGTTALQDAFVLAREQLPDHGVVFPSMHRQPMRAALAVTGRPGLKGEEPATQSHWERLQQRVAEAGDNRVMISSEFFADADPEQAARAIEGLGGPDVHVVVTLRPLSKILPSQWQQYVQNGAVTSYEKWLRGMLEPPYNKPNPSFWRRHDHPRLIEQWGSLVGYDRITAIVVDESDRTMLLRVFEALLGLPQDLLELVPGVANRSLSLGEVELLRLLNVEFKKQGWPDVYYSRFVRHGGIRRLIAQYSPQSFEPKIVTPAWAEERAAEIGQQFADKIGAMGVRVVGDLSMLAKPPSGSADKKLPEPVISSEAAARVVTGTIIAGVGVPPKGGKSGKGKAAKATADGSSKESAATTIGDDAKKPAPEGEKRPTRVEERLVANVRTRQLLGVVARRVTNRIRGSR